MRAVIPRRSDLPGDRGVLIVSYATHKKKAYSFFLVQVGLGSAGRGGRRRRRVPDGACCVCEAGAVGRWMGRCFGLVENWKIW